LEVRDLVSEHPDTIVGGRPVRITVHVTKVLPMMACRLTIVNSLGQPITTFDSEVSAPSDTADDRLGPRLECDVGSLPLLPGRYRVDVILKAKRQIQDGLQAAAFFNVEPGVIGERAVSAGGYDGDVVLDHRWRLPA
jgi:homopolymeric O-antigen transport system ATP-binding protein